MCGLDRQEGLERQEHCLVLPFLALPPVLPFQNISPCQYSRSDGAEIFGSGPRSDRIIMMSGDGCPPSTSICGGRKPAGSHPEMAGRTADGSLAINT